MTAARTDSPWIGFILLCSVLVLLVLIMVGGFLGNVFNSLEGWGGALQEAWSLGFGFDTVVTGSVLVGSTIASGTTAVVLGLFGTTRSRSMGENGEAPPPQTPTATATNGSEPSKC